MGRQWPRACYVITACDREQISETLVDATDIEEDFEGKDVITFKCPKCGESHKSRRYTV